MIKRWTLILLIGVLYGSFCRADEPGAPPETFKIDGKVIRLAHYAKAFIGSGNVTVEVAPYKQGDNEGAILLFHGIESPWDGKAINHEVRRDDHVGQESYATTYKGREWVTLDSRPDASGQKRMDLYVPDIKDPIALTPSDGAAQLTTPLKIFQEYQKQHATKEQRIE